jgi:GH15 family glucan-1,4-alpha-glucosidase
MSRPLVIGNGNLLVTLDQQLTIRDFYWPYVGLHNHLSGHRARLGVWVDGRFSWLSEDGWERTLQYEPETLVTDAVAVNHELGLTLSLNDAVLHREDILLRRFRFHNHRKEARELRLFLCHDFYIAETDIGDTAFYNPFLDAVIHYKRDNYFLLAARSAEGGIFQYAVGVKAFGGAEGTWRDAEDGWLSMSSIAQGSVDSAFSIRAGLKPLRDAEIRAWVCAAHNMGEATRLHHRVIAQGFDALLRDTTHYWTAWSDKEMDRVGRLPQPIPEVFRRSLLTIRTNVDNRGAIIAANDSDIMETARAHYSYMWPRDGALVASALDRLGYHDLTRRFFLFCRDILPPDRAALLHKYCADGSWGASWHPWVVEGHNEIPFQEDSTALVLWALWRHYERCRDLEFLESLHDDFILPCADFLASYRDPETGLPLPSYDLWEERRGIHAYTCGTLYGALTAAANISDIFHDGHSARYRRAAQAVREGMEKYLWDEEAGRFARRLTCQTPGCADFARDTTLDSALYATFAFGAFAADNRRVQSTMRRVISRLWVQTDVGGLARYEDDYYFRRSEDIARIPGNPWFICTLWAAQWYIASARTRRDMTTGLELLLWAARRALPSGIMPEQLHPETGAPLSVAPLTWSHAEFVTTTLDYLDRLDRLREE